MTISRDAKHRNPKIICRENEGKKNRSTNRSKHWSIICAHTKWNSLLSTHTNKQNTTRGLNDANALKSVEISVIHFVTLCCNFLQLKLLSIAKCSSIKSCYVYTDSICPFTVNLLLLFFFYILDIILNGYLHNSILLWPDQISGLCAVYSMYVYKIVTNHIIKLYRETKKKKRKKKEKKRKEKRNG